MFIGGDWYSLLVFSKVLMASGYGGSGGNAMKGASLLGTPAVGKRGLRPAACLTKSQSPWQGLAAAGRRTMSNCFQEQRMPSVCSDTQP